jgi:hypothetical protein
VSVGVTNPGVDSSPASGTMIRYHFTLEPLVLVFTCFFAVGAAVAVMVMHDLTFILALLFILVFGSAVSWGERDLIMGRLAAAINARPWACDNAAGGG